jgi:hypothetical protein
LSFGATRGLPFFVEHIKPIKVARSWFTNEFGFDKLLVSDVAKYDSVITGKLFEQRDSLKRNDRYRSQIMHNVSYKMLFYRS